MISLMSKDKTQADKFREAAKQVETDNDEKRFDETVKNIGKKPVDPQDPDDVFG